MGCYILPKKELHRSFQVCTYTHPEACLPLHVKAPRPAAEGGGAEDLHRVDLLEGRILCTSLWSCLLLVVEFVVFAERCGRKPQARGEMLEGQVS